MWLWRRWKVWCIRARIRMIQSDIASVRVDRVMALDDGDLLAARQFEYDIEALEAMLDADRHKLLRLQTAA